MTTPGPAELVIILLVLVLLFGARKLPELAGSVGKSITSFKRGMKEVVEEEETTTDAGSDEVRAESDAEPRKHDGA